MDAVVIITGAARGIGRAMALGLAGAGARIAAIDLAVSEPELAELVKVATARGLGECIFPVLGDVTDPKDCKAIVEATERRFGCVHGLVNNAAIGMQNIGYGSAGKKFFEVDVQAWRSTFEVNVNGAFIMARALAPRLVAQGWGRIVNITTSLPVMTAARFCPYGPSKAALEAATVIWSRDLAGTGVTVNALLPGGPANTRMVPPDEVPDRSTLIEPDVMIPPIAWLMSTDSDGVTGQRFIAKEWDPGLAPKQAASRAGSPAGWL